MNRVGARLMLALGASAVAIASAEIGLRLFAPAPGLGPARGAFFLDDEGQPWDLGRAAARGVVAYDGGPRGRPRWVRAHTFYICYPGGGGPSKDARGCVRVDINSLGLRDRADLTWEKPAGQQRIVCLGDSFTFGWGVTSDSTWVRLIEPELASLGEVRTINCGLAPTLLLDECWWELRDRYGRFEPDMVLVTVCLNDLAPLPNTVAVFREHAIEGCAAHDHWVRLDCAACRAVIQAGLDRKSWVAKSRLLDLLVGEDPLRARTQLDPGIDWGQWLLDMPLDWPSPWGHPDPASGAPAPTYYEIQKTPLEATWRGGGPQAALVAMRDWCRARGVRFGVVVWPLFQGLDGGTPYPFATLHRVVREFCDAAGIAVLDLLPEFVGRDAASLWVDPADQHGNEEAHRIAAGPIARFVARLWQ